MLPTWPNDTPSPRQASESQCRKGAHTLPRALCQLDRHSGLVAPAASPRKDLSAVGVGRAAYVYNERNVLGREEFSGWLTNLPGQWLQCQANGSNVCRVLTPTEPHFISSTRASAWRAKHDPEAKMLSLQSFLRKGVSLGYGGRIKT